MIWRRNKRVQQFSSSAHIDNFWQFQKQGFIPGQDSIPYPSHFSNSITDSAGAVQWRPCRSKCSLRQIPTASRRQWPGQPINPAETSANTAPGVFGPQQNPQQGPAEMSARTAPGHPTNPPARRSSTRPTGMAARTAGFGTFHGHRSPVGCYSHEAEQAVGTGVWILRWWYCHRKWNQTHQTTGGKTGGGRRTDASSTSTSSCRSRTRSCGRMRTSSGRTMLASGTSSNKSGACSNKPNTNCRCAGTRCSRGSSNDSKRRQCCWIQCSNMRESRTKVAVLQHELQE